MTIQASGFKVSGKLSFMHLTAPDDFNGKLKQPKYSFMLTNLSPRAVDRIEETFGPDAGMGHKRIKFNDKYPENGQCMKFSSFYPIKVQYEGRDIITAGKDLEGNATLIINDPIANTIGYGSEATVKIVPDAQGNPRAAFIKITDLVAFEPQDDDDDGDDEVL